jgi:SAM-dependent methyltransferase
MTAMDDRLAPATLLRQIDAAAWRLPPDALAGLDARELDFIRIELTGPRNVPAYAARIRAIGFDNLGTVLDAGCGIGQWSDALAAQGNDVIGVDLSHVRLKTARRLASGGPIGSKLIARAGIERLPLRDASVDGVFCYGVFMFADMPATLREFARVLRPRGKLYLNANTLGWYLHLAIERGARAGNWPLFRTAVRMAAKGFFGGRQQALVKKSTLLGWLEAFGFVESSIGAEGSLNFHAIVESKPFYPTKFYGATSMWECVARKAKSP